MKVFPGMVVDFFAEGEITAGVVLAEEKGRLRLITEAGREERIAPGRVLAAYEGNSRLALPAGSKADTSRHPMAHALAAAHAKSARDMQAGVDLSLLWEIVVDEGGERHLADLAELALGEGSDGAVAGLLRALLEEKVHFTRRDEAWSPRAREAVAEILHQRERERQRALQRGRFLDRLRRALVQRGVLDPRGAGGENGDQSSVDTENGESARLLAALEETAVQAGNASAAAVKEAQSLVDEAGIRAATLEEAALRALIALGVFTEDENIFIRRFGLRVEFPEGAEEIARRAVQRALGQVAPRVSENQGGTGALLDVRGATDPCADAGGPAAARAAGFGYAPLAAAGEPSGVVPPALAEEAAAGVRRDLTGLDLFSVDDELTSEIDDALSVQPAGPGRYRVGIHIADPGFFIPPDSDLDRIAAERAVTFYLPERRVLMLPSAVSENASSLLPGEYRPALSFFAALDEAGTLLDWEIVPSVIRSRGRVTYEEASRAVLASGAEAEGLAARLGETTVGQLRILHRLAAGLEAVRLAAGAHVIRAPEVDLSVAPDGTLLLKRLEGDDPGRVLVSEMMVLAGRITARFCLDGRIPCIYRRQPPAEEPVPPMLGGPYDPVAVRRARRGLRRSESGLTPGRHFALGLDAYAQSTSPIRRYQDLAIHRQIKNVLAGGTPCYDIEAMQRIAALTDDADRIARLAERGSDEYWTLKYLARRKGQTVEGTVVFVEKRRVEVELCETLYTAPIVPRPDHEPGQSLRLMIEEVNPRTPLLTLRQVD